MPIELPDFQQNSNPKDSKEQESSSFWDFMNRDIQLFGGNKFSNKKKLAFYEELEVLLTAGLDIQRALELIQEGQSKKKDAALFQQIIDYIIAGSTLSEALEKTKQFSLYEIYSIQIGEESSRLKQVLKQLADFFQKSLKYRRQLVGALSYPVFVLSFSLLAVFFLLRYLVPMFSGIYGRFGNDLPTLTQYVVNLSEWIGNYAPYAFLTMIVIGLGIYSQRKRDQVRQATAWLLLKLPIFGGIIQRIYLARFCESMSLLLAAKVPLLQAVALVRKMIRFYPIERSLESTETQILQGEFLYAALQQFPFYPKRLNALIRVGEESGKLDSMFKKLAEQYNAEVDQKTAVIGNLIEPILIIVLGLVVGIVLVAMYLPLFNMSSNMGM